MSTSTPLAQPGAGGGDSDLSTGTRIETESESDFWSGLRDAIEGVFDSPDGRNVMVNPISGVVAVRAYPHEQRAIGELLDTIQGSVQRQVILEAKIVEVELHDAYRSGINWTALQDIDGRLASFGQIAGADIFDEGISSIRDRLLDVRPGNPFSGFDGEAFGGSSVIAIDTGDFNAFIELLETQGVTRVLSSPRVATINNQKAVIKVGTDEFFVTGVTGRTATGGTSTTAASSVQLTPFSPASRWMSPRRSAAAAISSCTSTRRSAKFRIRPRASPLPVRKRPCRWPFPAFASPTASFGPETVRWSLSAV